MTLPKLTLDLIPESAWGNNIRKLVSKAEWDVIRMQVYARANHRCEICGGVGPKHPVEAHEAWRFERGRIVLERMVALCPACHQCKHWGLSSIRGLEAQCYRHLCKVNGWDRAVATKYVNEQFQLWDARSQEEWVMDLAVLAEHGVIVEG